MRFRTWLSEFVNWTGGGLRSIYRVVSGSFFPQGPAYDRTVIDYDMARQLYRNDAGDSHLGAGFCKPIIDRAVEFIGIPAVSSDNEQLDELVNSAIERHWKPQLVEMFRNSMRDSKCFVRIWQPLLDDPLATEEERVACTLTIYEPERVTVVYDPRNPRRMTQAIIVTKVDMTDEVQPLPDPARGAKPQIKEHEIWEVITPDSYRYFDRTEHRWRDDWARDNPDGIIPMVEVWNEYDSALSGGQSDLESVYPFIKAFHEVLRQALQAHSYHSTPKLKFKVTDMLSFLQANFPSTIDPTTMQPIAGASIPWKGREVLFIGQDEDIEFLTIDSVLGDSKTLLEFLIDCIAIASETPEWAFMRVESGGNQNSMNAQTIPFEKKIERKRNQFQEPVQLLVKMMLKINGREPDRMDILWQEIRVDSLVTLTQAMQQFVMTLEVLLERKLISENTAREALKQFRVFKTMKSPSKEATDAEENMSLDERNAELDLKAVKESAKMTIAPNRNGNGNPDRVPAVSGQGGNS